MKPELGPLKAGDEVIIVDKGDTRHELGRVMRVSRVLAHIARVNDGNPVEWTTTAYRLESQQENNPRGVPNRNSRFVTAEQHAWEKRQAKADAYLDTVFGPYVVTEIRRRGKHFSGDRLTLANLIRSHFGLDPL